MRQIKGIDEFLQISMCNNMPLSVNEKRRIFDLIINLQNQLQQKENIIKEVRKDISEIIDYIYQHGFYYDSDEGAVPNELGMYEIAHITGELNKLINEKENK